MLGPFPAPSEEGAHNGNVHKIRLGGQTPIGVARVVRLAAFRNRIGSRWLHRGIEVRSNVWINAHQDQPARGRLAVMSMRFRALMTVTVVVVGALAWGSAASASSEHRIVTKSACEMSQCDAPAPDSCRPACPHSPGLAPGANSVTIRFPWLREFDFAVTVSVASRLNLSDRLDRPPQ